MYVQCYLCGLCACVCCASGCARAHAFVCERELGCHPSPMGLVQHGNIPLHASERLPIAEQHLVCGQEHVEEETALEGLALKDKTRLRDVREQVQSDGERNIQRNTSQTDTHTSSEHTHKHGGRTKKKQMQKPIRNVH